MFQENSSTQLLEYRSIPSLLSSDHKPVCALFSSLVTLFFDVNITELILTNNSFQVKVNVVDKMKNVYEEIVKELDSLESKTVPEITLSSNLFNFGFVRYASPITDVSFSLFSSDIRFPSRNS